MCVWTAVCATLLHGADLVSVEPAQEPPGLPRWFSG